MLDPSPILRDGLPAAGRLCDLALACVSREFPCNPAHVVRSADDLHRPRVLHPAFFGCFDWHSAVHGHWLLAHLLRRFPALAQAGAIRKIFDSHLTADNLLAEARYLEANPGFERPYGWAWLLKLADELSGERWHANLLPLVAQIELRYLEWLPQQTYPIRTGTHANTAFSLAFALDHARATGHQPLEQAIVGKCMGYYAADRDYPAAWELGGNDFFSPCLIEADLMCRVLPDFQSWFADFLPDIPRALLEPATVSDRDDGQLAHLDGLNLSRAWCYFRLAGFSEKKELLLKSAQRHLQAGLAHVASGRYAGEHWLATFAAYALACA